MADIRYIGDITLQSLRNVILDENISSHDSILLHPNDFDDIALEYRETYCESLHIPFVFVGIEIKLSQNPPVPLGRIRIEHNTMSCQSNQSEEELYPPFEIVYRCGWCGNVVDRDGALLDSGTRLEQIRVIEKFGSQIEHIRINGQCCKGKHW